MAPKPVIDQRAAEQMNLNVLRRLDPDVEQVGSLRSRSPPLGALGAPAGLSVCWSHVSLGACVSRQLQGGSSAGVPPAPNPPPPTPRPPVLGPAGRLPSTCLPVGGSCRLSWHAAPAVRLPARSRTRCPAALLLAPLQLLATAGHVALYDFEVAAKKWVS